MTSYEPIDKVTTDLFHNCAITAYRDALIEGKQDDQNYVKRLAYKFYEAELKSAKPRI